MLRGRDVLGRQIEEALSFFASCLKPSLDYCGSEMYGARASRPHEALRASGHERLRHLRAGRPRSKRTTPIGIAIREFRDLI